MGAHARLSPSAADRWMTCPGSVRLLEAMGEDRASEFAAEGTVAHQVRSDALELGLDAFDFVGQTIKADGFTFEVTDEMAAHVQVGIDRVRELGGKLFVEHKVDLSRWHPDIWGTLDTALIRIPEFCVAVVNGEIRVIDLKFGQGVPVRAEENTQLKIYALGIWDNIVRHLTDERRVVLEIEQPRAGGTSEWETTVDDLLIFAEEMAEAARRTEDSDAPLVASPKGCFWCRVKDRPGVGCAAYDRMVLDMVGARFEDIDEADMLGMPMPILPATDLTPERRSFIVQNAKLITGWLDALHADTLNDALQGRPTPGLKAVSGRKGDRYWTSKDRVEAILVAALAEGAFNKKLISPAEAEKILKPKRGKPGDPEAWNRLQKLYDQDDGKPSLVSASDERPALKTVDQKFSDLMDSEDKED